MKSKGIFLWSVIKLGMHIQVQVVSMVRESEGDISFKILRNSLVKVESNNDLNSIQYSFNIWM